MVQRWALLSCRHLPPCILWYHLPLPRQAKHCDLILYVTTDKKDNDIKVYDHPSWWDHHEVMDVVTFVTQSRRRFPQAAILLSPLFCYANLTVPPSVLCCPFPSNLFCQCQVRHMCSNHRYWNLKLSEKLATQLYRPQGQHSTRIQGGIDTVLTLCIKSYRVLFVLQAGMLE